MAEVAQAVKLTTSSDGQRLDRYLAGVLEGVSRAEIQRWIKDGLVSVDGRVVKASYRLAAGEMVLLLRPEGRPETVEPEPIALDVVYEDDELLVVNKPAGMVVHPAPGHREGTVVNALLARFPRSSEIGGPERSGVVHRLDRDTSGLLLVAKTPEAHAGLQAQFKDRAVRKTYLALVEGQVEPAEGRIDAPIGRDPSNRKRMAVVSARRGGRSAVTDFRVLGYFEPKVSPQRVSFTLLELDLHTGRTHQIRVHLAFIKHPVVGDRVYGRRRQLIRCPRQFLHAAKLVYAHPTTHKTMEAETTLPEDLEAVLGELRPVVD